MTQEALADRLGVTYQSISRWENGTTYPDLELIPAIADALELGAMRREAVKLTYEQMAYIESIQPVGVPLNVMTTFAEYYIANKPYGSD